MQQINKSQQLGMSKWAWLATVIVLVFAASAALRLAPHYVDFSIIGGVFDRLPEARVYSDMSKRDIREPIAYNADVVLSFAEERIYK